MELKKKINIIFENNLLFIQKGSVNFFFIQNILHGKEIDDKDYTKKIN